VLTEELYPPRRLADARRATAAAGLDALLITPGADLRYLTGYHAHEFERLTCLVLPAEGEATLIVPRLERPAAEASPAYTFVTTRTVRTRTPSCGPRSAAASRAWA
jgi:Xaa-Pro aminopeptidase